MTIISRRAEVPYKAQQMFELVDAIEQYPEFLPGCSGSVVHSREDNTVQATLYLSKGGITQSFTTENYLWPHERIQIQLVEGPFRQLEGVWQFKPLEAGCEVRLDLTFEFSNKLIEFTVGPIIQKAIESYVETFSKRAKAIYG